MTPASAPTPTRTPRRTALIAAAWAAPAVVVSSAAPALAASNIATRILELEYTGHDGGTINAGETFEVHFRLDYDEAGTQTTDVLPAGTTIVFSAPNSLFGTTATALVDFDEVTAPAADRPSGDMYTVTHVDGVVTVVLNYPIRRTYGPNYHVYIQFTAPSTLVSTDYALYVTSVTNPNATTLYQDRTDTIDFRP